MRRSGAIRKRSRSREGAHDKAQHQHHRRIVQRHGRGQDESRAKQLADVVGQCAADRQDEPCGPERELIVEYPHHQQGQQSAAEREEACRPAGDEKDEQRLEQVEIERLPRPHEEQCIHHHDIRKAQLHARRKARDDQGAFDEGKRHRQREQQAGKCDLVCFLRVMVSVCHRLSPFAASVILRRRRSARTAPAPRQRLPMRRKARPDGSADR